MFDKWFEKKNVEFVWERNPKNVKNVKNLDKMSKIFKNFKKICTMAKKSKLIQRNSKRNFEIHMYFSGNAQPKKSFFWTMRSLSIFEFEKKNYIF